MNHIIIKNSRHFALQPQVFNSPAQLYSQRNFSMFGRLFGADKAKEEESNIKTEVKEEKEMKESKPQKVEIVKK